MNGEDLLAGITQIDDELIVFAESYRKKKKSNYKAVLSIAASFCLLIGAVMAFVMQSNEKPYESDDNDEKPYESDDDLYGSDDNLYEFDGKPYELDDDLYGSDDNLYEFDGKPYELDEDGKINILSIPGALQIDTPEKVFFGNDALGNVYEPDTFVDVFRNGNTTIVYGSIKNRRTVSITDNNLIWYITTFDINVIDNVKNAQESSTIKAASINCYDQENAHFIFLGLLDSEINIASDAARLFFLKTAPSESLFEELFEIDGEQYSAYDFADYYAMCEFDCDGESFYYFGSKIELDRLRD